MLTSQGIPICILNACQSGEQVGTPVGALHATPPPESDDDNPNDRDPIAIEIRETSLGSRLMTAGVQMVVAMGYSVTVSAAALMMEKLYGELFAERGIPEAIPAGAKGAVQR